MKTNKNISAIATMKKKQLNRCQYSTDVEFQC